MPLIPEPSDKVFFENAHIRRPHRYHELFLRSRPYRGEPPTVAGLLLYPDTPSRMETTSREAFCVKGDHIQSKHPPSSRETPKGNSSRGRRSDKEEYEGNCGHPVLPGLNNEQKTAEMKSQYQRDFTRLSSHWTRQTPAWPQPDNLGINPAFRIEFGTVQKEAYRSWLIMKPREPDKQKPASSRKQDL
ncbi:hypothetical protein CHARACLAT_002737 [Characodon lateralis]|uniref:Uncharacterized protein n=1 Tax=Characodon lateralis TaxID=208331 RepID=A0ABU7F120_9TELE|nr:hypothetical protein [Characodon lateralis]